MITGEDISSNKGEIFHLCIITLMHRALQSNIDELLGEGGMLNTVLDEDFHVNFNFSVNVGDG